MIVCDCLHKKFGTVTAVDGVSMEIKDGTFLGLLGPNGAGKTTLMRMMTGLLMPDTGTVMFDGQPMDRNAVAVKQAIGVTSQHMNLDKELTVEENMEFAGRLYRMGRADIAASTDRLLSFLGLESVRRRVAQGLSGGMKRKLMIAKALIHDPRYRSQRQAGYLGFPQDAAQGGKDHPSDHPLYRGGPASVRRRDAD